MKTVFQYLGLMSIGVLPVCGIEAPPEKASPAAEAEPEPAPVEEAPRPEARAPEKMPQVAASAYLGVGSGQVPEVLALHLGLKDGAGVLVRVVDPNGPAAKAGLVQNDVITQIDDQVIRGHDDISNYVSQRKAGDTVNVHRIHEGKPSELKVVLGDRPEPALGQNGQVERKLDEALQGLPEDQARRIRDLIQKAQLNGGAIGDARGLRLQLDPNMPNMPNMPEMDKAVEEMRDRVQKMFGELNQGLGAGVAPGGLKIQGESMIKLLDDQGAVELKSRDGGKEVTVRDRAGNVTWSGPWDTEQDKAAAPADVRGRIDRLNIDMDFKGNGLRLKMGPKPEPLLPDE